MICEYCNERRAVNADHLIPKSRLRNYNANRRVQGRPRIADDFRHTTVPACFECNIRKGARLLIPASFTDRLDELNDLGIGKFRVWRGDVREPAFAEVHK